MRIFSESPLDRRDHTNRLSCHIIHEFRFSRIDFCSVARCRQRAGESGSYDPLRAFTGISRVHSTATVARTVSSLGASYCTRIFASRASAFARLRAAASAPESAVGRKRAAPACGQKRLLRPTPRFHGNLPRPLDRHDCAHRALARRIVLHANLHLPRVGFRPAARRRQRAGESGSYDPLRAFTVISRVHSTATVARTGPLLGASRESSSPARRLSPGYAKCQRAAKTTSTTRPALSR